MWPVDAVMRRERREILYLCVGARTIVHGRQRGTDWIEDSIERSEVDFAGEATDAERGGTRTEHVDRVAAALAGIGANLIHGDAAAVIAEVRVVVSDSWLATISLPWSARLRSRADAQAYAAEQFAEAGFDMDGSEQIRLTDEPYGEPRLAVAYPHSLILSLQRLATELDARLASVKSMSCAVWAASGKLAGRGLAVLIDDEILLVGGNVRPSSVVVRTKPQNAAQFDATDIERLWMRRSLRGAVLAGQRPWLLDLRATETASTLPDLWERRPLAPCGAMPRLLVLAARQSGRADVIDAVVTQPRLTLTGGALLASATIIAGALSWSVWQYQLETRRVIDLIGYRQNSAAAKPLPARAASKEQLARIGAIEVVQRQLDAPIHAALKALQPARDIEIAVLSIDLAGQGNDSGGRMKIEAEARSSVDMTRYVAFLEGRKPLREAFLIHHEFVPVGAGAPYRFAVEVVWQN